MLEPFTLPFVQRGLLELALLSIAAGVLGTWIVLRGLAFFAHAVGTAAFPGLVLAAGLGLPAALGAAGAAAVFTAAVALPVARGRGDADAPTALALVGCLAAGVLLASDVFDAAGNVGALLFGSLLAVHTGDVLLAGGVSLLALVATTVLGRRWLARGFDPGRGGGGPVDLVLLALVALAAVAALSALGALLATALLVVPAATTRLWAGRLVSWQLATVALVLAEGTVALWLSVQTDAPPGATLAVLAGAVFALAALARWRPRATVLALAVLLAGCGDRSGGATVVASTTQLGDLARNVAGPDASVHTLLAPNTDPHEYEPRPSDARALAEAKVVLASGDGLDPWVGSLRRDAGGDARLVDVGAELPVRRAGDPHWWQDPVDVRAAVGRIARVLAATDPVHRLAYAARARRYGARLAAETARLRRCVARIPRRERLLVTDHDAFAYLAARFGLRVVGAAIPSRTTEAQASARDLAALAATVRRTGVRAVFPEASLSPRLTRALARETGARAGPELYGDALGPPGSAGATYLGALRANVDGIVRGLTRRGCG